MLKQKNYHYAKMFIVGNDYILKNIENIFNEIPDYINLVAVIKGRSLIEIEFCIKGGVKIFGINYIQEAEKFYPYLKDKGSLHMIGHLQSNKINKALKIFDMIQTIDSLKTINEIQKKLKNENKKIPILVEVNIAHEKNKFGVLPDKLFDFISELSKFDKILIMGLMTMGPNSSDFNTIRKYFKKTKELFDQIKNSNFSNCDFKFLSMGMSDNYKIAIDEGSNMIRIGKKIFNKEN